MTIDKTDKTETRTGWHTHWEDMNVPWDAGSAAPELVRALDVGILERGNTGSTPKTALVVGCGSGWDAFVLAAAGYEVTGLDLAPGAVKRFEELRSDKGLPKEAVSIALADFFEWGPDRRFDLIWDYTFLCAIPLERRTEWAVRVQALLKPDGILGTLIFPMIEPGNEYQGPPWPLHPPQVQSLLAGSFRSIYLAAAEASHDQREGKEWLGLWKL